MNKYLIATLIVLSINNAFAGNSSGTISDGIKQQNAELVKKLLDKQIYFEQLHPDMQTNVINFVWNIFDNAQTLKHDLESIIHPIDSLQLKINIPINFYTLSNKKNEPIAPIIKQVGYIAENLKLENQPTQIFLQNHNISYSTTLKTKPRKIIAACFSVLGQVALAWQHSDDKYYCTFVPLHDIKQKNEIDLEQNAIGLPIASDTYYNLPRVSQNGYSYLSPNEPLEELRSSALEKILFSLDGTKLGWCTIERPEWSNHQSKAVELLDIPSLHPLTPSEKAKRMGIATCAAKELVAYKMNKMEE